jgi:hypothetical protein
MSLQEFFLMRAAQEHQNAINSDNTGIILQSLAEGVAQGIQQEQKRVHEQKEAERKSRQAIDMYGKMSDGPGLDGGKLIPSLKMKEDGTFEVTAKTPTPSERKIVREEAMRDQFVEAVSSGASSEELGRRFAGFPDMIKQIKELEELNIVRPQGTSIPFNVNTISNDGGVVRGGVTPISIDDVPQTMLPSDRSDVFVTEVTPAGRIAKAKTTSGVVREEEAKAVGAIKKAQLEEAGKSVMNFNRTKAGIAGLVGAVKRTYQEQGGLGWFQQKKADIGRFLVKTGAIKQKPEHTYSGQAEWEGQAREVALGLSPVLTGQNRILDSVLQMIQKSLPMAGEPTTGTEVTAKLKQTAKNAFRLSYALSTGVIREEEINAMNNWRNKEDIINKLESALNRVSWTEEDEAFFEKQWEEIKNTPPTRAEDIFTKYNQQSAPLQILSPARRVR